MANPRLVEFIGTLCDGSGIGRACIRGLVLEARLDRGSQFPKVISSIDFHRTFTTRSTPLAFDSVRTDILDGDDKTMVLST